MFSIDKPIALPARAIEVVCKSCNVPRDEVARLYQAELAELTADARITSFLPIFAMRKVEQRLHQRRAAGT